MMKYTDYTIPAEIDVKIPDYFYSALAGELYAIFDYRCLELVMELYEDDNDWPVAETDYYSTALMITCKKLDMMWLYDYCSREIAYTQFVDFGEIILQRIIDRDNWGNEDTEKYFKYLNDIEMEYIKQFEDETEEENT